MNSTSMKEVLEVVGRMAKSVVRRTDTSREPVMQLGARSSSVTSSTILCYYVKLGRISFKSPLQLADISLLLLGEDSTLIVFKPLITESMSSYHPYRKEPNNDR